MITSSSLDDEGSSREKALKTLVAGQQAENLLDFDEPDAAAPVSNSFGGLSLSTPSLATRTPTVVSTSNPLDDLVSIFGSAGMSTPVSPVGTGAGAGAFGGLGGLGSPTLGQSRPPPQQQQQPQEDLLGLF